MPSRIIVKTLVGRVHRHLIYHLTENYYLNSITNRTHRHNRLKPQLSIFNSNKTALDFLKFVG